MRIAVLGPLRASQGRFSSASKVAVPSPCRFAGLCPLFGHDRKSPSSRTNVESQALALRRNARASVSRMLRCASRRAGGEGSNGGRGAGGSGRGGRRP